MAKTYREFMTDYMRKHKGAKDIKDVMKDGAKAWGEYKKDNGIVVQQKEKSNGPSYSAFVKDFAKENPGPDLMSRAAKAWKSQKASVTRKPSSARKPSKKRNSPKRKPSSRKPSRKRTRGRTPRKPRKK